MRVIAIALILGSTLYAQTFQITKVRNRFAPNAGICPGCVATISYSPEDLSFKPGEIVVKLNGVAAIVDPEDDGNGGVRGGFDILIPPDTSTGLVMLTISTPAGSDGPAPLIVDPYAPTLLGVDGQYSCQSKPAVAGDIVTAYAAGLGPVRDRLTTTKPTITVGVVEAEVLDATFPVYAGYAVRFVMPPGDGYHLVGIKMGGREGSSTVPFFVRVGAALDSVTAADYSPGPVAPETILVGVGCGGSVSVPTATQGDTTIKVKDSAGIERVAPLLAVTPNAVGYLVPAGTAVGPAIVTVSAAGNVLSTGRLDVQAVAPRFFASYMGTGMGTGSGAARGQVVRLRDGKQTFEDLGEIDMGPETDVVCLVLWVSGVRGRRSLDSVGVMIAGFELEAEYAGAQSENLGVDQLNVRLPRFPAVAFHGQVPIQLNIDGKLANATLNFK
jgi:uncharacterized protein (TIGR03437 family)